MFKAIRDLADAIMNLAEASSLASGRTEGTLLRVASCETRLSALESSVAVELAEAKALKISATEEKKLARNAENRTHTLEQKRRALQEDSFGDDEDSEGSREAGDREFQDLDEAANGVDLRDLHQGVEVPRRLTRHQLAKRRVDRAQGIEE